MAISLLLAGRFKYYRKRNGPNGRSLVTLIHVMHFCAGKTTLLKILAGKHMVGGRDVVQVLNGSAFHDTQLVCSGDLAYLGGSWSKTVSSAVSTCTSCLSCELPYCFYVFLLSLHCYHCSCLLYETSIFREVWTQICSDCFKFKQSI